jgi:hypothetical protein
MRRCKQVVVRPEVPPRRLVEVTKCDKDRLPSSCSSHPGTGGAAVGPNKDLGVIGGDDATDEWNICRIA